MWDHYVIGVMLEVVGLPLVLAVFAILATRRPAAWTARLDERLDRWRRLAHRPVASVVTVGAFAFAGCGLYAGLQGIAIPLVSDEFGYLLAADTFAQGRLANPPHPFWRHFEALNILQQPTYQGKYLPAQSLVLAAGLRLGHPILGVWIGVALMAGATTWMLRAWVSPGWAVLGGLLMTARLGLGFEWAQSYWGGAVTATGAALAYGGARRVFGTERASLPVSSAFLGLGLGILALTRPYEGLVASLPLLAMAVAWICGKSPGAAARPGGREIATFVAVTGATLLPLLAFLGLFNHSVTGNAFVMPHQVYGERYWILPELMPLGLGEIEDDIPPEMADLARMRRDRDYVPGALWIGPREAWDRMAAVVVRCQGAGLLACCLVAAAYFLRDAWARFAVAAAGVALTAHFFKRAYFSHYMAPSAPVLLLLGVVALSVVDGKRRRGRPLGRALVLSVLSLNVAFAGWSLTQPARADDWQVERREIERRLTAEGGRHLLFVRYGPYHVGAQEWVYNRADVDDSPVIWARDLGAERNLELVAAYPERTAWLVRVGDHARGPDGIDDPTAPIGELLPYPAAREPDDGDR